MSTITKNLKLRNLLFVISLGFFLYYYFFKPEPKVGNYLTITFILLIILFMIYELTVKTIQTNQLKKGMNYKQSLKDVLITYSYYIAIITMIWSIIFFIKR